MEGAGEDPFLGSKIAAARVRGFQGSGLGAKDAVMACVKHYAAYGAAEAGRDYNSVDMSDRMLWETYLPPFKAAAEAGAGSYCCRQGRPCLFLMQAVDCQAVAGRLR
ncbi:MAG TPA: glycoside hydrolase family 3 N-terminal domain-containing protein [Saprospiraceae bacterium]|nr:glycoside hydrolase family 3 N-terminal domain-containing protein [Saprospiraceae bacterium]